MKFGFLVLALGIANGAAAETAEPPTSMPHPEIGRYQIATATCTNEKNCVAFGIDTATGQVFACQYTYTPGIYDFGGQCKSLPHRAESGSGSAN